MACVKRNRKGRKVAGIVVLVFGVILILAGTLLYINISKEEKTAEKASATALDKLIQSISENSNPIDIQIETSYSVDNITDNDSAQKPDAKAPSVYKEKTVDIEGVNYLGYITFPERFNRTLPVIADWDFSHLNTAPTRYYGSIATNDLVIAAHNYRTHFNMLQLLEPGDVITFTDAAGKTFKYNVAVIEVLEPTAIDEMCSGEYALTLYTCTYNGGTARVTVRCLPA